MRPFVLGIACATGIGILLGMGAGLLGINLGGAPLAAEAKGAPGKPKAVFPQTPTGKLLAQMIHQVDLDETAALSQEDEPEELLKKDPTASLAAIRDGLRKMGRSWGPERVRLIELATRLGAPPNDLRALLFEQMLLPMSVATDGKPEESFYAPATAFTAFLRVLKGADIPKARPKLLAAYLRQKHPLAREALLARWREYDPTGAEKAPGASESPQVAKDFAYWLHEQHKADRLPASEKAAEGER